MNATYDAIGPVPTPNGTPQTFNVTLAAADYGKLPTGNYAKTSLNFKTKDDAAAGIPIILAANYPNYADKSSATVTYAVPSLSVKPADSTFAKVAYTLVNPSDYTLIPGNKFIDFSAAQILTWLPLKYPNPVANQLAVLTFIYFESGSTATVTQSFLYLNGAWQKIYTISAAQYTSIGKGGTNNDFASGDAPLLPAYFNTFLKADPAVSVTAKPGDVQYVSYKYFGGGTFQRVMPLTFDGTNWITTSLPQSLAFVKTSGTWVADNTVSYSLVTADYTTISNIPGVASDAAILNLQQHGNFSISGATAWTNDQIAAGIAVVLKAKFPAAAVNQKFVVTYSTYNGSNGTASQTLQYNGTTFAVPKP
jgi:hypothetical protein